MNTRHLTGLMATLLLGILSACHTRQQSELKLSTQQREQKFTTVLQQFKDPDKEFRTAPLWVWNTNVTTADIDRMLSELKDAGFGGAFVHPRPGLETEYLSPEWFALWDYALQKGKELGMDIWIYDENSYPSGFAGGHVPAEMPESYNQGTCLVGRLTQLPPAPDECYLCVLRQGDEFTDITSQLSEYQDKEGIYYSYTVGQASPSSWTAGFPYVDLLARGVTEKFIEVTFTRGYEKYLGSELGKSIKGTFTDEPNIVCPMGGHCRWTPDFFDEFQRLWGYDLRPLWPLLGEEVGPWQKVRHDYNATLLRLFIDRWAKPWYRYTEAHHMVFTGHYWEHSWPDLSSGPDNMAMYAWHQLPAIDMLFNQFNDDGHPQAQFGNVRSVRELRSVANQLGYTRTLCETYGGGGWDETLEDMKRLGDWEYALGVNFMNQHLSHMTITGARKYDYPPVFTSLSPWWSNYRQQNDYFARLSLLLSQGEQMNSWLVIEPTTSLWMHYTQVAGGDPLWSIANGFQHFITYLEKCQMEYDLGCEQIMAELGEVTPDGLRIGKRTYSTVVLPPGMKNLERSTYQLLKRYAEQGGRIIACSEPAFLEGEESDELKHFMQNCQLLHMDRQEDVLALFRQESDARVCVKSGEHVYHQRRIYDEGQLLFVVNSSKTDSAAVEILLPGRHLALLDAMDGKLFSYDTNICVQQDSLECYVTLPPCGSALFFASDDAIAQEEASIPCCYGPALQPLGGMEVAPLRQNALALDFCNLRLDDEEHYHIFYKEANNRLWNHYGRPDPWETAVQFRQDVLQADTFPAGDITVEYPLIVKDDVNLSDIQLVIEKPEMWQLSVNGTLASDYHQDTLLDARCGVYTVGRLLRQGENVISLHMCRMNIRAEVGPVVVLGRFAVQDMPQGFCIAQPRQPLRLGTYTTQGYPMYCWEMCYRQQFDIPDPAQVQRIRLGRWCGTAAEVWVNGAKAGCIAYPPYDLKLKGFLRQGVNDVEVRVIGSLANLYGPHYAEPNGLMSPWHWGGVGEQRPGAGYHLFPYGLEEAFVVE